MTIVPAPLPVDLHARMAVIAARLGVDLGVVVAHMAERGLDRIDAAAGAIEQE
jgi:hypothetical protein